MVYERRNALLLGSGISIPAGFPSVNNLTNSVLSGLNAFRHTDATYCVDSARRLQSCAYVNAAVETLLQLKTTIEPLLRHFRYTKHEPNYEDLVYVVRQLGDFDYGEIENPIVGSFLEQHRASLDKIRNQLGKRVDSIGKLARETEYYVRDVVWQQLSRPAQNCSHLEALIRSLGNGAEQSIIATLNHDNHLETRLFELGLEVGDGFGQVKNEIRYWDKTEAQANKRIALFKLHGSIDWFTFKPEGGDRYEEQVGIAYCRDIEHTTSEDGRRQFLTSIRPIMLVGTFNKYIDYSSAIFATIHSRWRLALDTTDRLAICGYGFGDRGVNAQIVEWVYGRRGRRLLVINPDINQLRERARGSIRNRWEEWVDGRVLETIDARIEDLDGDEIKRFFHS